MSNLPRYGVPGGPYAWGFLVNEGLPGECIVYSRNVVSASLMWQRHTHKKFTQIWSVRMMGDNE